MSKRPKDMDAAEREALPVINGTQDLDRLKRLPRAPDDLIVYEDRTGKRWKLHLTEAGWYREAQGMFNLSSKKRENL